jgi:hypothetical protein
MGALVFWFVQDVTQKKRGGLRNYPLIGHPRCFFERANTLASTQFKTAGEGHLRLRLLNPL